MSGSLEYTADGLDGDVSYDVQVRAVNSEGSGEWSTTSTGTPLIGAPTIDSVIVGDGDSSSRSNAQSISLGDQRNGLIDPLGDVDWFTFTLTQQTTVIVRGSSRIDGEILNSSGNSIDDVESVNLPASGFVHLADLAAGKYYIEVKPGFGVPSTPTSSSGARAFPCPTPPSRTPCTGASGISTTRASAREPTERTSTSRPRGPPPGDRA